MSERTRSKLAKLNNKNHNNHNNNQNNNTNVNKPGKPKRKQVYKSNNNNVNNNDNNNNAIEPINVEEEPIWEIHSEIFAQIYRPVVTRATVLRMYHMAKPLFRRKNLISGYLRANSLQPPKERKKSKEFSLEKFCTKRLNVVSREPKIIELENVEIKIPDLHNKKLQVLVTCYEVKHRRKKDEKTGRLRPWALEFTKLPQEQWSQTNDFGVKFGPILVDTSAIHCAPYLISTNYCVVFQAITYPANDKRLQNVKIKAKDKVELPYNAQYSSLEFVHEDIIDMSTRQMCDLYSEYLDLIEDGKLMPDAEYRLGTNVFPNMDQEPVDTVFKMKSYKAKGAEVIADNDANMIFEHVQVPAKRPYKAKRYFTEEPKYYEKEELIPKLRSLAHILPIEYQFRYSIKTGISDVFTDRVKVETRQNFKCPICLMNWHQLQPLLLHLVTTHLELEITWEKRIKHTQINISVDKRAVSVFGLPYTLPTGQSEFYKFNRLRYPQYELLNNNLEVVYAKKKKNKEKRKVVLSSDGRAQKYRSQTLEPIPTHQLDYDSEDEENIDRSWMKEDNEKRINDFADFYPDERKFLIMWNNYVIDHPIRADRDVKHTCKKFATDLRTELQDENLYHLFMMYLHHMWELKLLSADDIIECAENVHRTC